MAPKPEEINVSPPTTKSISGSAGDNAFVNNAFEDDKSVNNNSEIANMQFGARDTEEKPSLDFDDLLPYIGEFGLYQKLLFLCMIPFAFFVAFVYFSQIFMTLVPEEHWCRVPELEHLNLTERLALSIPHTDANGYSKCSMYAVNFTEVLANGTKEADPSWPTVPCHFGWEYNFTEIPYTTIATDLDWVCDNAALPSLAQSIFFVGAIVGGLLFGWIADRWGRIPALVWCNVIGFAAGIATVLSASFWTFALCRFIVGFAFDNCFTMMYILLLEYVGPKWRTFVANMSIAIFFTTAASILPWIAYYLADWKLFTIVTSAPLALAILTPWVVPESARWLVSQGKIEKAIGILKRFEKVNGKTIDPQIYKDFSSSCVRLQEEENANNNYSILDLFKTPRLRRITILLIIIWMAISLVFDGHVRNVGSLGLDLFITFTIASATEFPADTVLTLLLDRWGRRWMTCGSMVISGIFSLLATTVPVGIASATLAIFGRFSVNISYSIGLQYAAELLPTVVRAQGVAFIHIMGYVASIVAPFVVYLANIDASLPLIILGILGVLGGLLSLYLPETLDKDLPQTLADGEEFGRGQKIWEFPCCGKKPAEKQEEPEKPVNKTVQHFKRGTSRGASLRASTRGELRSSILQRSTRSRYSGRYIPKSGDA